MSEYNVELQDGIVIGGNTPTGEIEITENGKVNVSQYASADVNVPQGVFPTGTKNITENGTSDVTNYASVNVQVPQPSGKVTISENGTNIDIAQYATADVAVPTSDPLRLSMTFNNQTPASADGTIYLETDDSTYDGNYDIFWGDSNGVMVNYSKIGTIAISATNKKPMGFIKLMEYNAIPKWATKLCAVKNGNVAADFDIPAAKLWSSGNYGEHLYSFGLLSDVHVQYSTGHDDVHVAMSYLNERESVVATCISGDLTRDGTVADLEEWKTDRDTWSPNTPVYASSGNHEARTDLSIMNTNHEAIRQYLDSDYSSSSGDASFYKVINGDVFVFIGIYDGVVAGQNKTMFSGECLEWLENLLETYRNQRVFLFAHVPPHWMFTGYSGFASGNGAYSSDIWGSTSVKSDRTSFLNLLEHYKNVIWFSGHTHIKYEWQKLWDHLNLYKYKDSTLFVHVSSLTVPRDIVDGSVSELIYAESEGSVVDVYTNCIRIRCRNFVGEKFLGYCEYFVDTTPTIIPPHSKTVVSISATKTKTNYYTDETLSTSDITVMATYSDSSTNDVSNDCVFNTSNVHIDTEGTYSIGISYTYGEDTVSTSVQVTSEIRAEGYTVVLDASFDGTMNAAGGKVAPTSNGKLTQISGNNAYVNDASLYGKSLYYRLLADTGIQGTAKVGLYGGVDEHVGSTTGGKVREYRQLVNSEWTLITDYATGGTDPLVTSAQYPTFWLQFASSSSATATFPVNVGTRIQVAYQNEP